MNLFSNGYALFWNEAVIAIPSNAVAPPVLEQFEVLLSELSRLMWLGGAPLFL